MDENPQPLNNWNRWIHPELLISKNWPYKHWQALCTVCGRKWHIGLDAAPYLTPIENQLWVSAGVLPDTFINDMVEMTKDI